MEKRYLVPPTTKVRSELNNSKLPMLGLCEGVAPKPLTLNLAESGRFQERELVGQMAGLEWALALVEAEWLVVR